LLDELVLFRPAFDPYHLLQHWSYRLDLVELLAGARQVIESASLRIQVPFSRSIQSFERAFQIVEIAWLQLEYGPLSKIYHMIGFVHRNNWQTRFHPPRHYHDFGIADRVPRFQVVVCKTEPRVALCPFGRFVRQFRNLEVTLVWMPGADCALAVDRQLAEHPWMVADFWEVCAPNCPACNRRHTPTRDAPAPTEHRTLLGVTCEHHARILRREFERLG
jgi:hypothetical protein